MVIEIKGLKLCLAQKIDDKDTELIKQEILEKIKQVTLAKFDEMSRKSPNNGPVDDTGGFFMSLMNKIIHNLTIKITKLDIIYIYHVKIKLLSYLICLIDIKY